MALDAQVDSQPLVVPNVTITAGQYQGLHDVVYVATENNTIYAIDASSGVVLLRSHQLGTPVSMPTCRNNSPNVGITSTPVIDVGSNTIYAMAYSSVSGIPTYTLHALDLGSLIDKAKVIVKASHTLAGGTAYKFNATVERQRPALLLANGNVYAAFGSFCDHKSSVTRGWVVGWNAGTLAPLPHNIITDTQTSPQSEYYLSSVWMSGYGLAADASGNIYFVTGNSDPKRNVYDGVTDIQESVVKLSSKLDTIKSIFQSMAETVLKTILDNLLNPVKRALESLVGGLIGILLGASVSFLGRWVLDFPTQVPAWAVLLSLAMSSGVGLVFGIYPAARAARLDPVEAMRAE